MNTFSKMWNIKTPEEAERIIKKQIADSGISTPQNLEQQAISMVGHDIYIKLIKGYTEKQWGRSCRALPPFIIKRLPVRFIYNNNYFNDKYQGIPIGGYTNIIEKMLAGSDVSLNTDFLKNKNNYKKCAGKIIYTGMIDEYFNYCFGELEYRSLKFEEECPDTDNFQGNAVVNYTDYEVPYTRIIEHKHFEFSGEMSYTVITKEYPAKWKKGSEPYYPINDKKNTGLYQKYKKLADTQKNIIFGGRLGMYKYNDMDDTIESALNLSKLELK